ncbi:DUF4181 domain-containing protein [Bacillus testis]|uniref:DUF4181 domain-containing protein n=1 Tax=Bacillus testis TaxID=1622072 RepID=UPI00067F3606|nr:DUF4181 domain-containing protein [Bacillus testis]
MTTIASILILTLVYLLIEVVLRKKQHMTVSPISRREAIKGRHLPFLILEAFLLLVYLFTSIYFYKWISPNPLIPVFLIVLFLFCIYIIRGMEEYFFKKEDKEYVHSFLGASFFLMTFLIMFITHP